MDEMLQKIFNDIQKGYNDLLNNCFLLCGYSEEYVKQHPEEFEVLVNGKSGFTEVKEYYYKTLQDVKVTMILLFSIKTDYLSSIKTDYSEKIDYRFTEDYRVSFTSKVYRGVFNGS